MFNPRYLLALTVSFSLLVSQASVAGSDQAELVDELRYIVEKSRRERSADHWLQGALEDLLAKYHSPWQREILYEDFRDGDYAHDPAWHVLRGRFRVVRGQGLYTATDGYSSGASDYGGGQEQSASDTLSGLIVGTLLDKALGTDTSQGSSSESASTSGRGLGEIRLKAGVTNAFAIDLGFRHTAAQGAGFEIALLQSESGRYGYRLRVQSGTRGVIELLRVRGGRNTIVETHDLTRSLADGQLHELSWRHGPDGTITIAVDDESLFKVRDRPFRDPYNWLHLRNEYGDLTVRSLRISGT